MGSKALYHVPGGFKQRTCDVAKVTLTDLDPFGLFVYFARIAGISTDGWCMA
jgi:hypothetical protein